MIDRHQADTGGPRLASRRGLWTYTDPAVHALALRLDANHGINLAAIDDWIEGEHWPDPDQLRRVLDWRERILQASSDDAAEGWGMYMLTLAAMNVRERFLHPLALLGKDWGHRLPKPGERATLRAPKKTTTQRKSRDKRILALAAAGKTKAQIASAVSMSERQVYRLLKRHRP